MRYFKIIENGYVAAIGKGFDGEEITADEHSNIQSVIKARPTPAEGKDYHLTEALEWEEYDKPVVEVDPEATEEDYQDALAELGVEV